MITINDAMGYGLLKNGQRFVYTKTGTVFYVTETVVADVGNRLHYNSIEMDVESGKSPFRNEIDLKKFGDHLVLLNGTVQGFPYPFIKIKTQTPLRLIQGRTSA